MMKFTAVTRVLTRWMLYTLAGGIALRLWAEGMFYLSHLMIQGHPCGGLWFSSAQDFSLHLMMLIGMTVATFGISAILWFLWMWANDLAGVFVKSVNKERECKR